MCLVVTGRSKRRTLKGWKVYSAEQYSSPERQHIRYGPFYTYTLKNEDNTSSGKGPGYHVFYTKRDALRYARYLDKVCYIPKAKIGRVDCWNLKDEGEERIEDLESYSISFKSRAFTCGSFRWLD